MSDAREQIMKLASERNRDGKKPLTKKQLIEQFQRIRDGSAAFLEQCVIYGTKDGIKEAQMLFETNSNLVNE